MRVNTSHIRTGRAYAPPLASPALDRGGSAASLHTCTPKRRTLKGRVGASTPEVVPTEKNHPLSPPSHSLATPAYPSRKCNVNLPLLEVARSKPKASRAIEYGSMKLRPELASVEAPAAEGGECRRGHKSTATSCCVPLPFTAISRKAWVSQEDWSTSPRSIPPSEIPSGVAKAAHPSANNDKSCTDNNKMNRTYPVALIEG